MSNTANRNQASTSYRERSKSVKPREAALGVLHGDGWVQFFAERHIDVHIAVMPYMTTVEGRLAAEQYLESTLPRRFRDLYWPGNLRAADMVRVITPADIAQRNHSLALLRSIEEAGKILRSEADAKGGRRVWIA